jgi:multiple sugar transport system permease protein
MLKKFTRSAAFLITVAPFIFLILGAMSSDSAIARLDFKDISLSDLTNNLSRSLDLGILQSLLNTLAICLPMVLLQVSSSILAAYAFAYLDFKAKRLLFILITGSYLIPAVATFLPLYFVMTAIGIKGTPLGILLPFVLFSPYAIVMLRERFEAVPRELLDQAKIDGLGNWGVLTKIVVPLTRSFLALLSIITFVSSWNAFLWPRLIAGSNWPTITVAIAGLQSQYDSHWNLVLSATLIAVIPALSVFAVARKNLMRNPLAELEI